jgi:hypothetical protein
LLRIYQVIELLWRTTGSGAVDAAGNADDVPASRSWSVDTTPA